MGPRCSQTKSWIAEKLDSSEEELGTTITWEKLDRIKVDFEDVKYFCQYSRVRDHIALTFHRFMEGKLLVKYQESYLPAGKKDEAINPFRDHPASIINERHIHI